MEHTRKRKRQGRIRRMARKAGRYLAGAVLAAGLMLSPMEVMAKKQGAEKPRLGLNVKMGAAYDYLAKETRALISIGAGLPLPMRMRLDAAMGLASAFDGVARWEELSVNLALPIAGPVAMDAYAYNNAHLAVTELSVGGDIALGLPFGAAIVAFEHILDGGQRPLIGILKVDAIRGRLELFAHGGWVTNMDAGVARGRVYLTPGKDYPTIGVDTIFIFNRKGLVFVDTLAALQWRF